MNSENEGKYGWLLTSLNTSSHFTFTKLPLAFYSEAEASYILPQLFRKSSMAAEAWLALEGPKANCMCRLLPKGIPQHNHTYEIMAKKLSSSVYTP